MILYDTKDWLGGILICAGTAWPRIKTKMVFCALYTSIAYIISDIYQVRGGTEASTILTGTMSFLLIFRANQAYARWWQGYCAATKFFSCLQEFIVQATLYTRGGIYTSTFIVEGGPGVPPQAHYAEDAFDGRAHGLRVDICRLCTAMGVALHLHTLMACEGYCFGSISAQTKWLVDWDRLRLRQLLTKEEFQLMDGTLGFTSEASTATADPMQGLAAQFHEGRGHPPEAPPADWPDSFEVATDGRVRQVVVLAYILRELLLRNMNDASNNQPWGIRDRFVAPLEVLLQEIQLCYEQVNQIIQTPLPLPYANLCKYLLSLFLLSMPFFVDYRLGWFANTIIPSMVALCLLAIDAIGTELENPFGDDDNDLDLLEPLHILEKEAMEVLKLTGDNASIVTFCWRRMPTWVSRASSRTILCQLGIRKLVTPEAIMREGEDEDLKKYYH